MKTQLQNDDRIVFIGDSITDCERRVDVDALGNGFVRLFHDLLLAREPEKHIHIINRGLSGETVVDLAARWQRDVIAQNPDWLYVMIGINDVHAYLNKESRGVDPQTYRRYYHECLALTRQKLPECRILLIDPFYICQSSNANAFQASVLDLLPEYHKTVEEMAATFQSNVLHMHQIFAGLLQHQIQKNIVRNLCIQMPLVIWLLHCMFMNPCAIG